MPSKPRLFRLSLRVFVRPCLGLLLLVGLCLALGVQVRPAHAQSTLTITDCSSDSQLQADVSQANTDNNGDTITFSCSGDIKLSKTLTISGNMTIDGSGQSITLDGQQQFGVFLVNGGANLTLNALTISNGTGTFNSDFQANLGGGINNEGGTVSISNSTVSHNAVSGSGADGGGIVNFGGTLTLANSTVSNNSASNAGGGIDAEGGTTTITNSTVSNNSAGIGGGINNEGGTVSITNSTVSGNSASYGGGIDNKGGTTTITNSTVSGNSASFDGGGIDTNARGTTTISNSTVSGNSAGNTGGGIDNSIFGDMTLDGITHISNSTVGNNSASTGGGIDTESGTVTTTDTIFANNVGGNCAGTPTDQGYNLSSDGSCGLTGTGSLQNTDPKLGPLASNSGPTQTMALQQGSPAIDAGPAALQCPTTDQRGVSRPDNGESTCDIGAYEFVDPVDKDLGLSGLPANLTVDATSPQGAVVTYTPPTATDESGDSPGPSVSCSPQSGSTFAIGTTTVTCTATDSDDTNSPVSQSFTVTVEGAAAQVSDQISVVQSLPIASGLKSSLLTQLQSVQADLQANNTAKACSDLTGYINHVKAQSGKGLTPAQAQMLLTAATRIKTVLAC